MFSIIKLFDVFYNKNNNINKQLLIISQNFKNKRSTI